MSNEAPASNRILGIFTSQRTMEYVCVAAFTLAVFTSLANIAERWQQALLFAEAIAAMILARHL